MVKLKLIEGGKKPHKATPESSGWDLYAREINPIAPGLVEVRCGVALQFSPDIICKLQSRSSLYKTGWVIPNSEGLMDPDFTGEYRIFFRAFPMKGRYNAALEEFSFTYPKFPYKEGDRCGQLVFYKSEEVQWDQVEELPETTRKGGFGHTGKR